MVEERIHLVPPLRRRVVRVPFGLHHPVWVEDPNFDLDYHLRRASLPAPGGPDELAAFVADVAGRALDPDSPLWELHVVEGLDSGHVAVVAKVHHALFDGNSGVEVVGAFLDTGPFPRLVPPPSRPWRPDPIPTEAELMGAAVSSLVQQPERAVGALRRTFGAVRDLAERNRRLREEDDTTPPPAPFRAPRTSLNGAISPHRRFATAQTSLEDIRAVRRAFGGTVNDVVLAAVATALRRLLAERGERLDDPLVALVPLSTRAGPDDNALGNRVSAMLVSLATQTADPVERYGPSRRGRAWPRTRPGCCRRSSCGGGPNSPSRPCRRGWRGWRATCASSTTSRRCSTWWCRTSWVPMSPCGVRGRAWWGCIRWAPSSKAWA